MPRHTLRACLFWVLVTYLLLSFVPQLGLMSLLGKGRRKRS